MFIYLTFLNFGPPFTINCLMIDDIVDQVGCFILSKVAVNHTKHQAISSDISPCNSMIGQLRQYCSLIGWFSETLTPFLVFGRFNVGSCIWCLLSLTLILSTFWKSDKSMSQNTEKYRLSCLIDIVRLTQENIFEE